MSLLSELQAGGCSANPTGIQSVERWDWRGKPAQAHGFLLSVFSFAYAAAISSQDGARLGCDARRLFFVSQRIAGLATALTPARSA